MDGQFDFSALSQYKMQLEKLSEDRKITKNLYDQSESAAVEALVSLGVRWVDESGTGAGPFWQLAKSKSDGSFNRQRYTEFFSQMLVELNSGKTFTPDDLAQSALDYLKQFEKRRLEIHKVNTVRQRGMEDLIAWLNGDMPSKQ